VVRLHRGDHAEGGEPGDVRGAQVLGVLDAEPPVPRAVPLLDALVDVEQLGIGPVADGVDLDLEAGPVGGGDALFEPKKPRTSAPCPSRATRPCSP
jgi:hypothetical protein